MGTRGALVGAARQKGKAQGDGANSHLGPEGWLCYGGAGPGGVCQAREGGRGVEKKGQILEWQESSGVREALV